MTRRSPERPEAANLPMTRSEATDAVIDIGLIEPLDMELRPRGLGYSVLVPVEQVLRLARRVPLKDRTPRA